MKFWAEAVGPFNLSSCQCFSIPLVSIQFMAYHCTPNSGVQRHQLHFRTSKAFLALEAGIQALRSTSVPCSSNWLSYAFQSFATPFLYSVTPPTPQKKARRWKQQVYNVNIPGPLCFGNEYLDALWLWWAVLCEKVLYVFRLQSQRCVEKLQDLRRGQDAVLRSHFWVDKAVFRVARIVCKNKCRKILITLPFCINLYCILKHS